MSNLQTIYENSPYFLKVLAASMKGYQLKWWRYGRDTEKLLQEALDRETWSPEKISAWQEEKLVKMLVHAAKNVPYYRKYWSDQRRSGEKVRIEDLSQWPVLSKEKIRKDPKAFVSDGINTRRLFGEHTSGTTGTPLSLWCSRQMLHNWYALVEARWRHWYGVSLHDRWGILGGQVVTPFRQTTPPFWVWNQGLRQLYMSVLHLKPEWCPSYAKAIENYRIKYLYGYTSALHQLALNLLQREITLKLEVVITNAEPLYDFQRSVIEACFGCKVMETYGQGEMIVAAGECEHHALHLWPEVGVAEVLDDKGHPVSQGQPGRIVSTGLLNDAMPLIRYDTLDIGALAEDSSCACGRNLQVIQSIYGRKDDLILLKDNRKVCQIDTIFDPHLNIKEGQIIQETLDDFLIRVVPNENWGQSDINFMKRAMKKRIGEVNVRIETVNKLKRDWNGKFRVIISKVKSPASSK
jgi:phenylacetate-CoA ligase